MDAILEVIGSILIVGGLLFSALGVVGILRLKDTYSRLHASGKTGTLGVILLAVGVAFIMPETALKVIALVIFLVFSNPVASHAIAAAVYRSESDVPEAEDPVATHTEGLRAVSAQLGTDGDYDQVQEMAAVREQDS